MLIVGLGSHSARANCKIWDPDDVDERAFSDALKLTHAQDPENPNWVKLLPVFSTQDKERLAIREVSGSGGAAIMKGFIVAVGEHDRFFIKRTSCSDVEKSFIVSQTALVDPRCILERAKEG